MTWTKMLFVVPMLTVLGASHLHGDSGGDERKRFEFGFEVKGHYRDTDAVVLPTSFADPFNPTTPVMLTSVDPGDHFELSVVTLFFDARFGRNRRHQFHVKIDTIDLHDRNPTSEGSPINVDEAWVRFGREMESGDPFEGAGSYLKAGKFPHFERQDDRHLESYGLISTAFNRMEDIGLETGWRLGRHFYGRVSVTQGNPVFFRDPTALAGDNGDDRLLQGEETPRGDGLAILYDFETDEVDLNGRDPEVGLGLGLRFGDEAGARAADVLVWGYRRDLDQTVSISNSFYGGDLDLLRGPLSNSISAPFSFAVTNDEKREFGANLWLYLGGFSFFGQYVDQELAGLDRTGFEAEVAWQIELPLMGSIGGRQLFPVIAPAIRYSKLEPDFAIPNPSPSPSFAWEWEKIDIGLRATIIEGVDLTLEYAINEFIRGGKPVNNDEALATVRWRM